MPITSRVLGTYAGDGAGTFTVPLDSAPAAGEYVLVSCEVNWDATVGDVVSGYDPLGDAEAVRNTYAPRLALFGHRAAAGEGASISVTGPASNASHAIIVTAHTGVHATDPLAGGPLFSLDGRSSGNAPSLTSDDAPCRVLWTLAAQNYRADADTQIAWADATEITQATSTFCVSSLAYLDRADTSATGARAWSVTSPYSGNTDGTVAAIALREAPADPQLVETYQADLLTAPGTATVGPFTPAPGEVIVVKALAGHSSVVVNAPTVTGNALAFGLLASSSVPNYTQGRMDGATVPAAGTGPISISVAFGGSGTTAPTLIVERWSNCYLDDLPATLAATGATTATPMSASLTTLGTNSRVTWLGGDWQPIRTGTPAYRSGGVATRAPRRTAQVNVWPVSQPAAVAGPQTIGMTEPTGQKWTMLAAELRAGVKPVTPPTGPEPGRMLLAA